MTSKVPLWNTISTYIVIVIIIVTISIEYFAVTRENVKLKKLHVAYRVSITAVEIDNVLQYAKVTKVVFTACAKVTTVVGMA